MPRAKYDPAKAHDYYMRTRDLKGRHKGSGPSPSQHHSSTPQLSSAQAKVSQIEAKLSRLRELLRQKVADSKKSNGPEKATTADKLKDRQHSKEYYEKHKNEIKNDRAQASRKSGGGSSSKSSSSGAKTASSMSESELRDAIRTAVGQLKKAISEAKQLRGGD